MNAPFVVFADPYCPCLAHDDGASMQTPCALHGSSLDVNGNTHPQAAPGGIMFGSHHPETGNVHNRCSHPRAQFSGPFMFCFFWRLLRQSVKSGESDPAKSPPHQFTAAGAAPAGSASKRWEQHSAVSTALYSVEVLCKHSLISLPTPPEGRQLTGFYFKSPAMWRG